MQQHEAPNEQQRTLLSMKLVLRLWSEIERWPKEEQPKNLTQDTFFEYVLPYQNALAWLRHLVVSEGEGARISIVDRAFAREGGGEPKSGEITAVERTLVPVLVLLSKALDLEQLSARELLSPTAQDEMWSLDAKAVQFLEAQELKESAEWLRKKARENWKNFQGAQSLETPRSHLLSRRALWWLWESEELVQEQEPPLVLAHLIARGLVKERKKKPDIIGWNQAGRIVNLHESRHLRELSLGYCAREFVLCGLPYKPTKQKEFVRRNGNQRLKVYGDPEFGIPFGQDRLIPVWLASAFQASGKPDNDRIYFRSASDILRAFDIPINGHEMQILRERLQRVFGATYQAGLKEETPEGLVWVERRYQLITEVRLWFRPQKSKGSNQYTLGSIWQNYIQLDPYFAQDLREHSLPIDLDTVRALKRSPAVLDLYAWQAWRSYRLHKDKQTEARIPVFGPNGLWLQFGSQTQSMNKAKEMLRGWQKKLREYWPQCPNELTSNAEWLIVRPAVAVHQGAKMTLPGVSRRPPQLRKKKEVDLLEAFESNRIEETLTPEDESAEPIEIHLYRPPGKDPFPKED